MKALLRTDLEELSRQDREDIVDAQIIAAGHLAVIEVIIANLPAEKREETKGLIFGLLRSECAYAVAACARAARRIQEVSA